MNYIINGYIELVNNEKNIWEILSVVSTFVLSFFTIILSHRANNINKRLFELEESREKEKRTPILKISKLEYDIFHNIYNIKPGVLYYKIDDECIKKQKYAEYLYYIALEFKNLTDCRIESFELKEIKTENKKLFIGRQESEMNENILIEKNETIKLNFLVTEQFYSKVFGGEYSSLLLRIKLKNIYGEEFMQESHIHLIQRYKYLPKSSEEIGTCPYIEKRDIKNI